MRAVDRFAGLAKQSVAERRLGTFDPYCKVRNVLWPDFERGAHPSSGTIRHDGDWPPATLQEKQMPKHPTTAWASFPSREEADQAIQRLSSGGFARNSIDLDRQRDGTWNVVVHTSEPNLQRVERLLRSSAPMQAAFHGLESPIQAAIRNPAVALGAAALAGLVVYGLLHAKRRPVVHAVQQFPRRVWETAQTLPESVREMAHTVQETISDLPGTIQGTVGALTGREDQQAARADSGTKR
jgi:hypothetical protein